MLLEPCLSNLATVLGIVVSLKNCTGIPCLPQTQILQGPQIVLLQNVDIIRPTHNSLNPVKPFYPLQEYAPPYYDVSTAMFDCLLGKSGV
jgi:hypothetical protein